MPIINIPNTYVLIIDIKKDDEFKKRKFIVNSFTPEKADKLFFEKFIMKEKRKLIDLVTVTIMICILI